MGKGKLLFDVCDLNLVVQSSPGPLMSRYCSANGVMEVGHVNHLLAVG